MVPDGASNGRPQGERTMCSPSDYAHLVDRDACPDCLPLGTFPDGSGWPCARHQPPSLEEVIADRTPIRPAILVAADALGLDDCPMGCSCRGGAL